jgi:hypothetical protein
VTSPVRLITVECPDCGEVYGDWHRASINLMLDDFHGDYLDEASSATCPACGHRVALDVLVIDFDGTWRADPPA